MSDFSLKNVRLVDAQRMSALVIFFNLVLYLLIDETLSRLSLGWFWLNQIKYGILIVIALSLQEWFKSIGQWFLISISAISALISGDIMGLIVYRVPQNLIWQWRLYQNWQIFETMLASFLCCGPCFLEVLNIKEWLVYTCHSPFGQVEGFIILILHDTYLQGCCP